MTREIYNLFADNKPLPKGTRIRTTSGGVPTGGTHELPEHVLKSANACPNHLSEYVPFWILGWRDLHESLSVGGGGAERQGELLSAAETQPNDPEISDSGGAARPLRGGSAGSSGRDGP